MSKKLVVTGIALALVAMVAPVNAQSCNGTGSCNVTSTASVSVPALVDLNVAGAGSITLTSPTVADLTTGHVQDAGPSITVKSNRSWRLQIHTTAATNWTYTGDQGGVKPITDLTWATTAGGSYSAITTTAADVTSGSKTNSGAPTLFFRTLYSSDFSANKNSAGSYSIPLVFTLIAP